MIKSTELRIGNLVKCKVSNDAGIYQIIAVDGINLKVMLSDARRGEWYSCDDIEKGKIKPIPLTEDWLLKFGFHIERGTVKWDNPYREHDWVKAKIWVGDFKIIYDYRSPSTHPDYSRGGTQIKLEGNGSYDEPGEMNIEIKFVHQLQNLFFALTGEELTIKDA